MTDFAGLLSTLTDAGVRFIIVGGTAATAHGSSRLTQDIDVAWRPRLGGQPGAVPPPDN